MAGMAVPEPNSPEALRAAQKVRNIFCMIAAANLVVIAIVMWPRPKLPPKSRAGTALPAKTSNDSQVREMETVNERLFAAYHGRDAERFGEVFSSAADPKPDEEYFRSVVIDRYADEFGAVQDKTLTADTTTDSTGGVLVYDFTSVKGARGKSTTVFRREDGELRVMQWRLEKR